MTGLWLTEDVWIPGSWIDDEPIGMSTREWLAVAKGAAVRSHDLHLIITIRPNFGLVRDEVTQENPDYPIQIIPLRKNLYGLRIANFEYRHVPFWEYPKQECEWLRQWHYMILVCRVGPGGDPPENPW